GQRWAWSAVLAGLGSDGFGSGDVSVVVVVCFVRVMLAVAAGPRPPPAPSVAACTSNVAVRAKPFAGVNFRPRPPAATGMKSPLAIGVVPSFWNSVPLATFVILKCVTSDPSAALREITSPDVVCTCASVVAGVTDGVSPTGVTVMVAVTTPPPSPPSLAAVDACTSKLPAPKKVADGVDRKPGGICEDAA